MLRFAERIRPVSPQIIDLDTALTFWEKLGASIEDRGGTQVVTYMTSRDDNDSPWLCVGSEEVIEYANEFFGVIIRQLKDFIRWDIGSSYTQNEHGTLVTRSIPPDDIEVPAPFPVTQFGPPEPFRSSVWIDNFVYGNEVHKLLEGYAFGVNNPNTPDNVLSLLQSWPVEHA